MDDITVEFEEDGILIAFSEDYFVFDDVYALPIVAAEKLLARLEAALREARGPHGKLFRTRKPLGKSAVLRRNTPKQKDAADK